MGNNLPFVLFVGPCMLESRSLALEIAQVVTEVTRRLGMGFIFKASFDKANRSSVRSARGVSLDMALDVFRDIRERYGCPVMTDVHEPHQCAPLAEVVDVLQIPALLCRQTDLLVAAARTGRAINIKKGQFLSPREMENVIAKCFHEGNQNVLICERGTCFGYNTLINDMKALPILAHLGCPVVFDATHSVQKPGALGDKSGGEREFVEALARAAIAIGVAGLFLETHPDPDRALSDGPNMVPLQYLEPLLRTLQNIDALTKSMHYLPISLSAT